MAKKRWYKAYVITEKYIRVYAHDEYEAQEKAEIKMGPLWSVEYVQEEE